jgi:hypothetical protein
MSVHITCRLRHIGAGVVTELLAAHEVTALDNGRHAVAARLTARGDVRDTVGSVTGTTVAEGMDQLIAVHERARFDDADAECFAKT